MLLENYKLQLTNMSQQHIKLYPISWELLQKLYTSEQINWLRALWENKNESHLLLGLNVKVTGTCTVLSSSKVLSFARDAYLVCPGRQHALQARMHFKQETVSQDLFNPLQDAVSENVCGQNIPKHPVMIGKLCSSLSHTEISVQSHENVVNNNSTRLPLLPPCHFALSLCTKQKWEKFWKLSRRNKETKKFCFALTLWPQGKVNVSENGRSQWCLWARQTDMTKLG